MTHLEMNECLLSGVCSGHMREGQIDIKTGVAVDDADKRVTWAEVWHMGELVHRSVHAHLKRVPQLFSEVGQFG